MRGSGRVTAAAVVVLLLSACSSAASQAPAPSPSVTASGPAPSTATTGASPILPSPSAPDISGFPSATANPTLPTPSTPAQLNAFLRSVFADAQQHWQSTFAESGLHYTPASLVLFSSAVRTGCGTQTAEVGPFYCPADGTVYLDTVFFDEMLQRYGVDGDFAQAYVVAHELGHHVQALTGVNAAVAAQQQAHPAAANQLSIMAELQADCYAGVWAHSTYRRGLLEAGDLDEALTAAASVGDDFLQASATGTIQPEAWTHGSSAQRQRWLTVGYQTGKPSDCDTFAG